jgi:hypothetical protein
MTEVYECKGCHRNLFSYDVEMKEPKSGKRFNFECPMCGKKGWIAFDPDNIIYDKFLTDPKLKGKTEEPPQGQELPPPPPGMAPEGETVQTQIRLQLAVNPPGSISPNEEFVLQEILNTAMAQFEMIVRSGQVDAVAEKMRAVKREMESGVWTPESGMPPGGPGGPSSPLGEFPENL